MKDRIDEAFVGVVSWTRALDPIDNQTCTSLRQEGQLDHRGVLGGMSWG